VSASSDNERDSGQNRRRYRRYAVADLQGVLELAHPARVIDLSRSGAAIETSERLSPGRSYRLQLERPDAPATSTTARVAWCRLTGTVDLGGDESSPLYRAGLHFDQELSGADTELLDRLEATAREGVDIRLQARYKLSDLASTLLLRDRSTFEVRTLSRGGMGAEMEYSPRVGAMLEFVLPLDEPVEVRGRVADVSPAEEDPRRFLVGIEFVALHTKSQALLDSYLDRLRSEGPRPPVSG
jgi:hypothetical protein